MFRDFTTDPDGTVVASIEFTNGRWGRNTAFLARRDGGYSVGMGDGQDPFFYRCPVQAKREYRALATRLASSLGEGGR